jgi:hypothetical protein
MLAGIVLPFLATIAGKVIGDLIAPSAPSRRPSGSDGEPAAGPTFAQALAAQGPPAGAPAAGAAARTAPPLPADSGRAALAPAGRRTTVAGAFAHERGDPAGPVEAP